MTGNGGDMTLDMLAPGTEENALFIRPPEPAPAEPAAPPTPALKSDLTPAEQRLKDMAERIRQRNQPL